MKGNEFIFGCVDMLYYKCHEISLIRSGSYPNSLEQIINKKATIKSKNNDDKCFQYALTAALIYQNIKNNLQTISKIMSFINQYNWK